MSRPSPYSLETLPTNRQPPTPLPAPRMAGRARARAERRGGERPSPRLSTTVHAGLPDSHHRRGGDRDNNASAGPGAILSQRRPPRQRTQYAAAPEGGGREAQLSEPTQRATGRARPPRPHKGGRRAARSSRKPGCRPDRRAAGADANRAADHAGGATLAAASPGGPPGVTPPPGGCHRSHKGELHAITNARV